jgi:hypothetical protein
VEVAGDSIGTVIIDVPRTERADASLIVGTDLVSCGLAAIPIGQIKTVDHKRRRVVLRDRPVNMQRVAASGACDRPVRA